MQRVVATTLREDLKYITGTGNNNIYNILYYSNIISTTVYNIYYSDYTDASHQHSFHGESLGPGLLLILSLSLSLPLLLDLWAREICPSFSSESC